MYKESEFTKPIYKPKDVATLLGVTHMTLCNYDKQGKLKFSRLESGRRVILKDDLLKYLDEHGMLYRDTTEDRCDYIYARVSTCKQKTDGDLDRQALFLIESVKDLKNPVILKEVGSGLNDSRKQLQKLIQDVADGKVRNVYVTYKDRLTRFGYRYLETMFNKMGTTIVVVQDSGFSKTAEQELTEDMMSLLASFSGKLYGMRRNKNRIKGEAD